MIEIVDWDPRQVPGLQGWFSARAAQTSGSEVLTLRNLVTGSDDMAYVESARKPTIETVGGRQWIRTTGDGLAGGGTFQYMRSTEAALLSGLNAGFWIAATVQIVVTGGTQTLLHMGTGATTNHSRIFVGQTESGQFDQSHMYVFNGTNIEYLMNAADDGADPDPADTAVHLLEWWRDGTSINREYDASGTVRSDTTGVNLVVQSAFDRFQLFAGAASGTFGGNHRVQDILIAPTRPTGTALQYIQNGLMKKAGLL